MVRFSFAGEALVALDAAALFWPRRRALLLADLHFEKASCYARGGQMLPPYDSEATLDAIEALAKRLEPAEIWCLGDSFHDDGGAGRLPAGVRARIGALTAALRWTWISGNHDAALGERGEAGAPGGIVRTEAVVDGIWLRHEAAPGDPRPEISGHFHPRLRVKARGRQVSRRCFVLGKNKIILPAFGTLTGGLDVAHPAIRAAIGGAGEALVPAGGRLLRFPIGG